MSTTIDKKTIDEPTTDGVPDAELRKLLWREQLKEAEKQRHGRRAHLAAVGDQAPAEIRPGVAQENALRLRDPLWKRWDNIAVGSLVAAVVMWVMSIGLYTGPIRFDDEGTYVSQAIAVLHGSLAPYTYWYDHPPFGWIVLSLWMGGPGKWFPGPNPIGTGRQFMVLVTGLTIVFMYLTLRRLDARRWVSVLGCLAFGLSPLSIEFHRMVLLDNIAIMFLMAALMFSVSKSRRLVATGLCGLAMAAAVLSKETTLLMLPFVVWMLWRTRRGETRAMCLTAFGLTFTLPLLYYPLMAVLRGELLPGSGHVSLWTGITYQLFNRASSGNIFKAGTNAHSVAVGWFSVDWYLLVAGAALAPLLLFNRRRWALLAATIFQALMLVRPGYLPTPYVLILLPLAAMCVTLGLDQICTWIMGTFGRHLPEGSEGTSADRVNGPMKALWKRIVAVVAGVALLGGAAVALPHPLHMWQWRDSVYMQHNFDQPYQEADAWLEANVPTNKLIVVDNVLWTDLVDKYGRSSDDVVWFTKLGDDSAVVKKVPTYKQIDYVVTSDIMRTTTQADSLEQAISHSKVVASFGSGSQRIEIRQVQH